MTPAPPYGPARRFPFALTGTLGLAAALAAIAVGLGTVVLMNALPPDRWLAAILDLPPLGMSEIVFVDAVLPRMTAAILAGALLGLAGAVFQQVLRNPLATPDTLGVTSGAQLALAIVTLAAPDTLALGRVGVALAGGALVVGLVLVLSAGRTFAASVLMTGLVGTLYVNALTTLLVLFYPFDLAGLLVWAGGSLAVQDWRPVLTLAVWGGILAAGMAMLARPLALFSLGDAGVRTMGGRVALLRTASLVLAVGLTATVSGSFGAIGFVSLAAPTFARISGVRRLRSMLAWSTILGALVLWAADNAAVLLSGRLGLDVPTGAAVAILGAPLLIYLAVRQREGSVERPETAPGRRHPRPALPVLALTVSVALPGGLAILLGRGMAGWTLSWPGPDLTALLPWRAPRTVAAGAAGALLGLSGYLLQRVTGNALAAPEMLGLSAGAAAGLLAATIAGGGSVVQNAATVAGSVATALALLGWIAVKRVEPGRVLVTGLAATVAVGALVGLFQATGDPRAMQILAWMTGSTYDVGATAAAWAAVAVLLSVPCLLLARRWLDMMPLGSGARRGLGLPEARAGGCLILFAATLAGCGTLIVGPLSFVGLVAPRLAAVTGLQRALPQGAGTLLCGALLMIVADWTGRVLAFPSQIPSGIVAALLGSPILIALMARSRL